MKKTVIIVVAVLILLGGIFALYYNSYPLVSVVKSVTFSNPNFDGEYYRETVSIVTAGNDILPDSPKIEKRLSQVAEWNDSVVTELLNADFVAPLNIKVSSEVKDGKTVLRYEGYVTTKDGEKQDYLNEKTFDFVLCPEKRLFTGE